MDCIYGTGFNPTLHDSAEPDIIHQMLTSVRENTATAKKQLSKEKFHKQIPANHPSRSCLYTIGINYIEYVANV